MKSEYVQDCRSKEHVPAESQFQQNRSNKERQGWMKKMMKSSFTTLPAFFRISKFLFRSTISSFFFLRTLNLAFKTICLFYCFFIFHAHYSCSSIYIACGIIWYIQLINRIEITFFCISITSWSSISTLPRYKSSSYITGLYFYQ